MNVRQLKQKIKNLPDHMDVFIGKKNSEFHYSLLNEVNIKEINFKESPDGKIKSKDKVVLLKDV